MIISERAHKVNMYIKSSSYFIFAVIKTYQNGKTFFCFSIEFDRQ